MEKDRNTPPENTQRLLKTSRRKLGECMETAKTPLLNALHLRQATVANGERILVKIEPTVPGTRLNGFMVQARSSADFRNYQNFGTWIDDAAGLNGAQSCISFNDTAFSDSHESWDSVNLV